MRLKKIKTGETDVRNAGGWCPRDETTERNFVLCKEGQSRTTSKTVMISNRGRGLGYLPGVYLVYWWDSAGMEVVHNQKWKAM